RLVRWVSLPGLRTAVHLALTREAVWSAYRREVRRWLLPDIEQVKPRAKPIGGPEAVEAAAAIRRSHRDLEGNIRAIGRAHVAALVVVALAVMILLGKAASGGPGKETPASLVAIGVLTALGAWLFAVNLGLRR